MNYPRRGDSPPAIAAAAVAALAIGAFSGGVLYLSEIRSTLALRQQTLADLVETKTLALEHWMAERRSDLEYFASNPDHLAKYARLAAGDPAAHADLKSEFETRRRQNKVASVLITSGDGRVLLAVPPREAGDESGRYAAADAPRLRAADRGGTIVELSAPLALARPGARLVFRFDWQRALHLSIAAGSAASLAADYLLVRPENGRSVQLHMHDPRTSEPNPIADRVVRGERSRIADLDDRSVFSDAAALPVKGTDWLMIARSDRATITGPARRNALLLLAGLTGTILFAYLLFERLSRGRVFEARKRDRSDFDLLAQAIHQAAESVVITNAAGTIEFVNPAFTHVSGYTSAETIGANARILKSGKHDPDFYAALWATLARNEIWKGRLTNRRKDGSLYQEDATISPVRDRNGIVTHYIAVKRDVSNERSLENQLQHAQKMEAIGRLAGGVAHDFNNILTSILGYAQIAGQSAPPGSALAEDLNEITRSGRLAAALTRQLLTFSRKQIIDPTTFDLNPAVGSVEKMLRRTLKESIALNFEFERRPLWVRLDPSQIDQIVLNLAVNAGDAMPGGGRLQVLTAAVEFDKPFVDSYCVVPAGSYARLSVIDNGHGITPEIMDRIFEPFFTTKEKGHGTGLGLSTVFGIVRQAAGYITVASAPGAGSTFRILLPLVPEPRTLKEAPEAARPPGARKGETVLLVEDREEVLRVAERMLAKAGYTVIACRDAAAALAAEGVRQGGIDLLLTDVVMPGIGGMALAGLLRARRAGLRVLFMSGHTDDNIAHEGVLEPGVNLIQKPFSPDQLLARVRAALDTTG